MLRLLSNGAKFPSFSLLHLHGFSFYSTALSSSTEAPAPSLPNYLVKSLGFSKEQSVATFNKLTQYRQGRGMNEVRNFEFAENADSVISFLQQNGLQKSQIKDAVFRVPQILFARVDKTLKPKFELLKDLGFSISDLAHFNLVNGALFRLEPAIQALRTVLGSDDKVVRFLKRLSWTRFSAIVRNLVPNVALLENYGIPSEKIGNHVVMMPSVFLLKTTSFRDLLFRVEEKWGVPRGSGAFLYAICVLGSYSEKAIDSKCELFKSFGWSDLDFAAAVRLTPCCLTKSEALIKNKLDFLMNKLGCEPAYLVSNSALLTCSLEKRLVPRHKVLMILKDRGLINLDYRLVTAVKLSEPKFVAKFIEPFVDVVPELHEVYSINKGGSSGKRQAKRKVSNPIPRIKVNVSCSR